jgi:hypothetical protein
MKAISSLAPINYYKHAIYNNEESIVTESCQNNMSVTATPALLGMCEERLRLFDSAWRQHLE